MNPWRCRRAGFTLTEILMATGILGVGLTMVAAVFPVAVDQSRRSQDATMAALSARSVCAPIRAQRDKIVPWLRKYARDGLMELTTTQRAKVPFDMRNYNPAYFLYYKDEPGTAPPSTGGIVVPKHEVTRTYMNIPRNADGTAAPVPSTGSYQLGAASVLWTAGGYIPVVFVTPLDPEARSPWLVTIAIYKSQGMPPINLDQQGKPQYYLRPWNWPGDEKTGPMPLRGSAGGYIIEWPAVPVTTLGNTISPTDTVATTRGTAYLIENVVRAASGDRDIALAATTDKTGKSYTFKGTEMNDALLQGYLTLPGAIAVYHTVLGE